MCSARIRPSVAPSCRFSMRSRGRNVMQHLASVRTTSYNVHMLPATEKHTVE